VFEWQWSKNPKGRRVEDEHEAEAEGEEGQLWQSTKRKMRPPKTPNVGWSRYGRWVADSAY
jgi:hypothetical protein